MNIKIAIYHYCPKLCQVGPQQNHPALPGHPLGFISTVYEAQKSPVPKKSKYWWLVSCLSRLQAVFSADVKKTKQGKLVFETRYGLIKNP